MNDSELMQEFLANGIVKIPVENMEFLDGFKRALHSFLQNTLGFVEKMDDVHHLLDSSNLNKFRMSAIEYINSRTWPPYFFHALAKNAIETLVGNELVMQRNINLSIQLPGDDSSLLPIHADVLQGDSPFEVVLWTPLVDCYDTKSMFFTRKQPTTLAGKSLDDLYAECDPYFVDCKYGECLIFSQNYFHGNVVNQTNETRWSLNCRFKSALTPYGDKKLGEFFEPLTIRPATRMGAAYGHPST